MSRLTWSVDKHGRCFVAPLDDLSGVVFCAFDAGAAAVFVIESQNQ